MSLLRLRFVQIALLQWPNVSINNDLDSSTSGAKIILTDSTKETKEIETLLATSFARYILGPYC